MTAHQSDIIITGSPSYQRAFDRLLKAEGGYVNHPADRGGATKYGISLRFLVAEGKIDRDADGFYDYDLDMDGDIDGADIAALTIDHARALYRRCFWDREHCESYPRPLGEMLFDQAGNGGAKAARKLLQSAINKALKSNKLKVDGAIGAKTEAALDVVLKSPSIGMSRLVTAFREAAADRYRAIAAANPSQKVFLNGWLRRANELGRNW